MAYMERNTNFSIEAHTRLQRGTFFWLQVYERVWTSHKGVLRISSDPEIIEQGQKSKPLKKKNPPAMDHNLTPPQKKKKKNSHAEFPSRKHGNTRPGYASLLPSRF